MEIEMETILMEIEMEIILMEIVTEIILTIAIIIEQDNHETFKCVEFFESRYPRKFFLASVGPLNIFRLASGNKKYKKWVECIQTEKVLPLRHCLIEDLHLLGSRLLLKK
jgi:hypothetical protein